MLYMNGAFLTSYILQCPSQVHLWDSGGLKLNFDGSLNPFRQPGGISGIIGNDKGDLLLAYAGATKARSKPGRGRTTGIGSAKKKKTHSHVLNQLQLGSEKNYELTNSRIVVDLQILIALRELKSHVW